MVLKYGVKTMSNSVVLNIPLQNTLTPTVGSYSGEGRTDTTFDYDSSTGEYSLYSGSSQNPKGYYFYTPSSEISLEEVEIDLDVKSASNSGIAWILVFNTDQSNYWGIQKHIDMGIWLYYSGTEKYISTLGSIPLNTWVHVNIKFTQEGTTTYFRISKDNGTPAEFNIANKDFSINSVSVLGSNTNGHTVRDYYIKNIQIKAKTTVIPHINFHIGNEVCRAYSEKPVYTKGSCSYSSLVDPTVIANAVDVDNNGEHLKYSIPIVYENGSVEYITAEHPHVGAIYQNVVCTNVEFNNALNEYVISRNTEYWGISTGINTGMQIYSELGADGPLGFQGSDTITIEFNMIISGYYYGSGIVYLGSFYNSTGSSSFSFAYRSDTKYITNLSGGNALGNESVKLQTSLALETPYNFKIIMHKDINTNTLYAYVYIDNNLVYSGNTLLVNGGDNYTNGYFTLGFSNRVYRAKLGGFKVTHGREIKCLNVKRNNNLYYLLASNTGSYPSRLRAKIDGTTYPILLKHDEDNT